MNLDQSDLTVQISYAPNTDGKLELAVMTQDLDVYAESRDVQKSAQCINIKANQGVTPIFIHVAAALLFADQDDRVDYQIQVVETDLDANPRGECDHLNFGLYDFHPWPMVMP